MDGKTIRYRDAEEIEPCWPGKNIPLVKAESERDLQYEPLEI